MHDIMEGLPQQPSILVYPSPTAKAGRFDCSVVSLSVLLDYRLEDNKEHSFEVFCFHSYVHCCSQSGCTLGCDLSGGPDSDTLNHSCHGNLYLCGRNKRSHTSRCQFSFSLNRFCENMVAASTLDTV